MIKRENTDDHQPHDAPRTDRKTLDARKLTLPVVVVAGIVVYVGGMVWWVANQSRDIADARNAAAEAKAANLAAAAEAKAATAAVVAQVEALSRSMAARCDTLATEDAKLAMGLSEARTASAVTQAKLASIEASVTEIKGMVAILLRNDRRMP